MAEKLISPGVFTDEIDQTFLPSALADIGGAVVGPTVKGPALVPTIVTSYSEYVEIFGDSFISGSGESRDEYTYLTSMTAKEYLKNSDKLTVVRILAGSYAGASAIVSSSIDTAIVGSGIFSTIGSKATGSITLFQGGHTVTAGVATLTGSIAGHSASFVHNGTQVDFVFQTTGSVSSKPNTSTLIYVATGSVRTNGAPNLAQSWAEAINNSGSLHGIPISASQGATPFILSLSSSLFGDHEKSSVIGGGRNSSDGGNLSGSLVFIPGSAFQTGSFLGGQVGGGDITDAATSSSLRLGGGTNPSIREVLKIHTLADGELMNTQDPGGTNGILAKSGSKHNIRWEISSVNQGKGSFTLVIRRGNDTHKRKQILETWNNVNLDPNSNNYVEKVIGNSYLTIDGSGGAGNAYVKSVGTYPNKSNYIRVEVLKQTENYLDDNGKVRVPDYSASLPSFASGSNSGSFGGGFTGGSDGTVQHPKNFYENITATNSQGLNPTVAAAGENSYKDALDLLSNQDEYDINLILLPGIIGAEHSSIASKAIDVCEDRGDCFVIVDPVAHGSSITQAKSQALVHNSSYAAMYWPWVQVADPTIGKDVWVPPSVSVAGMYSFSDKVAHEWFAPAGLARGTLDTARQAERKLTQGNRDDLYDSNINPIATFPASGVTVWGQKTLQKKSSALDRVNVRRLLIKVKKFIASSSRFLVFEQNNSVTRRRFLGIATPFLEQVQAQSGLNAFRVVMDESNNTPDIVDRNIMYGQIFIQPTRTAEFIVLDFTIQPTGASFPE